MNLSFRHMAVMAPVLVMLAASVGCGDESGTGGSAGSGAASSSASSSSAGGSGGMGTGGAGGAGGGTGGMGGMGTGGTGGGTGGSGGVMLTCDGGKEVDNRDGTKRCSITNEVNVPIMAPASVK